jgi:taurine dioxygenase
MEIIPTGGALGAEIRGVDVTKPLAPTDVTELEEAVLRHLLLLFRDQTLTEEEQVRFSRYFGHPEPHVRDQPDHAVPEIFVVSNVSENGEPIGALGNGELTFHSDLSYLQRPGSFSIVYAVEVPDEGGDTLWANGYAAYDALPEDLRQRVLMLQAVHRHGEEAQNPVVPAIHPIVRTHPETKRRATFVSPQFTRSIVGLTKEESDALLDALFDHVTRPEFVWTHHWRRGDLVMWDNRCTMHRREPFDASARRILKRTQMFGDAPVLEL